MLDFLLTYWAYLVPATLVIIGLLVGSYIFKNWQLIAAAAAIIGAVGAIGRAFNQGQTAARKRQELATQKAVKRVEETKREISRLSDAQVENELRDWVKKP